MEKIEVGYHPIGATGNQAYHKFIIYTKADGTTFQIHGGGDADTGWINVDEFLTNTSGFASFGNLKVSVFQTTERTEIDANVQRETVFEDDNLSGKFFQMVGMAQGIMEEKTEYNWLTNKALLH